mmetsp:Transcript_15061/g.26608  ORF Transcript_15061/g.26608 Transcript_15061/m.26608 type:complete len:408 (-) Transcript_15061:93-1316(-)
MMSCASAASTDSKAGAAQRDGAAEPQACDLATPAAHGGAATAEQVIDEYHAAEALWRTVRDYESLHDEGLQTPWRRALLEDPRHDARCTQIPGQFEAYAVSDTPVGSGVFLCPHALNSTQQRSLLRAVVSQWALPPNRSNLWPNLASESELRQGLADFAEGKPDTVVERLRWVTLGHQYDWTAREYLPASEAPPLPPELCALAEAAAAAVPLPPDAAARPFEAAICNIYHAVRRPSDRLGGHRDDVEPDVASPLVSVSLGLPCIFLLGGETRAEKPTPILLRSGSILVLAGRARQAFHGVPAVLVPPALQPRGRGHPKPRRTPAGTNAEVYCPWTSGNSEPEAHVPEAAEVLAVPGLEDVPREKRDEGLEEAVERLLTKTRVNFSIRSVGRCIAENATNELMAGPLQ